jgi:hypothetical protein
MISEIAQQLVNTFITNLSFVDKVAGLVVPLKKMDNKIEKTFPAAINIDKSCDYSTFTTLVPDSTKKSIIYCEKVGDITLEQRANYWINSANLRIIVWYNLNLINEGNYIDEGVIIGNVIQNIPRSLPNNIFTYVSGVRLFVDGVTTGSELFLKYSYDEVKTQFMTFPYGAFGIDVSVQYALNKCASELIPSSGCGAPLFDIVEFQPV